MLAGLDEEAVRRQHQELSQGPAPGYDVEEYSILSSVQELYGDPLLALAPCAQAISETLASSRVALPAIGSVQDTHVSASHPPHRPAQGAERALIISSLHRAAPDPRPLAANRADDLLAGGPRSQQAIRINRIIPGRRGGAGSVGDRLGIMVSPEQPHGHPAP
ncbi:hypothetical protein D4740_07540 [Actinomyces sp. 2119]|nr:hypothetical protein D4740_07540 [Actinomyces sp. 2119]